MECKKAIKTDSALIALCCSEKNIYCKPFLLQVPAQDIGQLHVIFNDQNFIHVVVKLFCNICG